MVPVENFDRTDRLKRKFHRKTKRFSAAVRDVSICWFSTRFSVRSRRLNFAKFWVKVENVHEKSSFVFSIFRLSFPFVLVSILIAVENLDVSNVNKLRFVARSKPFLWGSIDRTRKKSVHKERTKMLLILNIENLTFSFIFFSFVLLRFDLFHQKSKQILFCFYSSLFYLIVFFSWKSENSSSMCRPSLSDIYKQHEYFLNCSFFCAYLKKLFE